LVGAYPPIGTVDARSRRLSVPWAVRNGGRAVELAICLALGRTRLVGCWRSVDEVVAKLTAGELERGVPRGRGVFRDPNVGWALAIPCFPSATVNDQLINAT
jgi:hypothetical protein